MNLAVILLLIAWLFSVAAWRGEYNRARLFQQQLTEYRSAEHMAEKAAEMSLKMGMSHDQALSLLQRAANSGPWQTKQRKMRIRR